MRAVDAKNVAKVTLQPGEAHFADALKSLTTPAPAAKAKSPRASNLTWLSSPTRSRRVSELSSYSCSFRSRVSKCLQVFDLSVANPVVLSQKRTQLLQRLRASLSSRVIYAVNSLTASPLLRWRSRSRGGQNKMTWRLMEVGPRGGVPKQVHSSFGVLSAPVIFYPIELSTSMLHRAIRNGCFTIHQSWSQQFRFGSESAVPVQSFPLRKLCYRGLNRRHRSSRM